MGMNLLLFSKRLTVFSGMLFVVQALLAFLLPGNYISKAFWGFIPFFYIIVLASMAVLSKMAAKDDKKFSVVYMRINGSRFLLYLSVLLGWSFSFREDAIPFLITFFVFSFLYAIFEVSFLYRELKRE
jgi:hypothetical protein